MSWLRHGARAKSCDAKLREMRAVVVVMGGSRVDGGAVGVVGGRSGWG